MKKSFNLLTFVFMALVFSLNAIAQDTPRGLSYLIGMRASNLDSELANKGYTFVKTSKSGYDSYQNWWSNSKSRCITVRVSDGRVKSVVTSPDFDCNRNNNDYGNNNNYNNNRPWHQDTNWNDRPENLRYLVTQDALYAYEELRQKGFRETKTYSDKDNTFKLWYNSRTDQCIRTWSKYRKIQNLATANNCR